MRHLIYSAFLFFFFIPSTQAAAKVSDLPIQGDFKATVPANQHLEAANPLWATWDVGFDMKKIAFQHESDRIQFHLNQVIDMLRQSANQDSKALKNRRLEHLNRLEIYARNGVFPTNHYHQKRQPYFRIILGCIVPWATFCFWMDNWI